MHEHALHSAICGESRQRDEMIVVGVDAAISHESDEVQRRVLRAIARVGELRNSEEAAVLDGDADARQVLQHHATRAEVEVADLGIAHLAVGKSDRPARGTEQRVGRSVPEFSPFRGVGERDGVGFALFTPPPAVENGEDDRLAGAVGDGHL